MLFVAIQADDDEVLLGQEVSIDLEEVNCRDPSRHIECNVVSFGQIEDCYLYLLVVDKPLYVRKQKNIFLAQERDEDLVKFAKLFTD